MPATDRKTKTLSLLAGRRSGKRSRVGVCCMSHLNRGIDFFANLEFHRLPKNRPRKGEGMKLAVLAARVHVRRQRALNSSSMFRPTAVSSRYASFTQQTTVPKPSARNSRMSSRESIFQMGIMPHIPMRARFSSRQRLRSSRKMPPKAQLVTPRLVRQQARGHFSAIFLVGPALVDRVWLRNRAFR